MRTKGFAREYVKIKMSQERNIEQKSQLQAICLIMNSASADIYKM